MSPTTFGWLVLLFPLLGTIAHRASASARCAGTTAGWLGTLAIALSFVCAVGALISLLGRAREPPRARPRRCGTTPSRVGVDAKLSILVDPLSVFMALVVSGRLDADPPLLGRLHEVRPRATRATSPT